MIYFPLLKNSRWKIDFLRWLKMGFLAGDNDFRRIIIGIGWDGLMHCPFLHLYFGL